MLLLLDPYVDVILALALAYLSLKIVQALFGPLGGLPWIGGAIVSLEQSISRSVAHACGTIVQPVDIAVGRSLAGLAGLINRFSAVLRSHGRLLAGIASFLPPVAIDLAALRALVHASVHANTGTAAQVKTLERELHGIEHQVKQLERDVSKGIGEDILPKLRTLDREITHIDNAELPAIRSNVATAEGEIGNLFDWIRGKADIIGVGTFAGAIALALGSTLWKGLRCPSLLNSLTNRGCGLWSGLEDLLGLFIDALILTDLCAILPEAVKFFGFVEGELTGLISQAANAVCALPNQHWTTINVPAGPRPPAQAFDETTLASGG